MIFKKSISAKFIATVLITLLVVQAAGTIVLFSLIKSALFDSLQKRIDRAATFIAGISSGPLISRDYPLIDTYLGEILKDDDMNSVHVLDNMGNPVRIQTKSLGTDLKTKNPFLFQENMSIKAAVTSAGEKIGEVVIDYSAKTINTNIKRGMFLVLFYQIFIFLSVGLIMMFLFKRDIEKPVSRLNSAIEKITSGDLSAEPPELGENEIGSISRGFSFLVEKLAMTIARLNSTAESVAMTIKQMNLTFKKSVNGVQAQVKAAEDVAGAVKRANESQKHVTNTTEKLAAFFSENVSSLLEVKFTAEEIASRTNSLFQATEESYSSVNEMAQTAKTIALNAAEVLAATEETSASVEEMNASLREVDLNSKESAVLAMNTRELLGGKCLDSITDAITSMDELLSEVSHSSEIITHLKGRGADIEKILSIIRDVTEQTNLLSLNAAILAAQAGEYGKSFSIVADEIRALSNKTANSTKEIGNIIKTIQFEMTDAVNSISQGMDRVNQSTTLVYKAGEFMAQGLEAAQKSDHMAKAIEKATGEQTKGLKQITISMEHIRRRMSEVAKATEEHGRTSTHLLGTIGEIKETAEIVNRGIGEQASSTKIVSDNMEGANERTAEINQSIQSLQITNEGTLSAIEQIRKIGVTSAMDFESVSQSLDALQNKMNILKEEMGAFKLIERKGE